MCDYSISHRYEKYTYKRPRPQNYDLRCNNDKLVGRAADDWENDFV